MSDDRVDLPDQVDDSAREPRQDLAPQTGNRVIDAGLAEFGSIDDHPAAEHHDRLSMVADLLTSVLENSRDAVQTPIPGLRPRH